MAHIQVSLARDGDGHPPYEFEELDATSARRYFCRRVRYRIDGISALVYGLSRGDVVTVVRVVGDDERLWVEKVVEQSDHWTLRLLPKDEAELGTVAQVFQEIGCTAQVTPFGLVALDLPADSSRDPVIEALKTGRSQGAWDFDIGVGPGLTTDSRLTG